MNDFLVTFSRKSNEEIDIWAKIAINTLIVAIWSVFWYNKVDIIKYNIMNIFRDTTWKWWELKLLAIVGIFLGFALGTHFGIYLAQWLWLVWLLFALSWLYIMRVWLHK